MPLQDRTLGAVLSWTTTPTPVALFRRRIVPGQHLAIDPKGSSLMIAGTEKAKQVYAINHGAVANLTISSLLEAHKTAAIIHHLRPGCWT